MTYDTTFQSEADKKQNNRILWFLFVICILLILIGAYQFSSDRWGIFSFKTDLASNWTDVFTKYFFIIIAMERAAAVWVGITRNKDKRGWDRRINRLRELIEIKKDDIDLILLKQAYSREKKIIDEIKENDKEQKKKTFLGIDDPEDKNSKEELMSYLRITKQIYEFKRTKYEETTYRLITRIVFAGGIILAILGLSIFNDIIETRSLDPDLEGHVSQMFFYRTGDILVTGGLLGGGSKAFSVFINTLDSVFNRVKDPKGED